MIASRAGMAFRLMDVAAVFAGAYQSPIHQAERPVRTISTTGAAGTTVRLQAAGSGSLPVTVF